MTLSDPLFEKDAPSYFSEIAGPLVANYVPLTMVAQELYRRMLAILDKHGVEYFLFAGSLVGYVRDGLMPPWLDDIDLILFEDQIETFETKALPELDRAGFHTFRPNKFPQGGYHILALRETPQRDAHAFFDKDNRIKIPRAQLDVFYTTVNEKGLLKNLGHWGLYNRKKVPAEWVKPGTLINVLGRQVRTFSKYEKDVFHEYGDVQNNVLVYSHGRRFLDLPDTAWADFSDDFYQNETAIKQERLQLDGNESSNPYTPSETRIDVDVDLPFTQIVSVVLDTDAGEVRLTGEKQWFWAADLKKVCPGLKITIVLDEAKATYMHRAAHMLLFADTAECPSSQLAEKLADMYAALTMADATSKFMKVKVKNE